MVSVPQLNDEQKAQALSRALHARRMRAEVKKSLKNQEMSLSDIFQLSAEDEAIARMKVCILLQTLPRVGPISADAIMRDIGISPTRRVGGLGCRQRSKLIQRFPN